MKATTREVVWKIELEKYQEMRRLDDDLLFRSCFRAGGKRSNLYLRDSVV